MAKSTISNGSCSSRHCAVLFFVHISIIISFVEFIAFAGRHGGYERVCSLGLCLRRFWNYLKGNKRCVDFGITRRKCRKKNSWRETESAEWITHSNNVRFRSYNNMLRETSDKTTFPDVTSTHSLIHSDDVVEFASLVISTQRRMHWNAQIQRFIEKAKLKQRPNNETSYCSGHE